MADVLVTETFHDLPFPRAAVWSVLRQTDWLNRSLGLPAVVYQTMPLPEGGSAVHAAARVAGLKLRWREWPFEWREPEFYQVRREFFSGPLRELTGGIDFLEAPGGGTRLRVHSQFFPRHLAGSLLVKTVLAPQATRDLARVVAHIRQFLAGQTGVPLPHLPVSPANETLLAERCDRLRRETRETALVNRLAHWLRTCPDVELTHIRPKALAREWQADTWATLRVLLFGAHNGLLQFRWEVLCPNCRSARTPLTTSLAELKKESHCDVCQIKFDAVFDQSVELKFRAHPAVRPLPEQTFCLAGPGGKPHIVQQLLLSPQETREWKWPAETAGLRLRSPQVKQSWLCESGLPSAAGQITCLVDDFKISADSPATGWMISNPNPFPVQVSLERVAWSEDILTAAAVTDWQVFRDLFAAEVVSPGEQIMVSEQAVMFTDLRGSTAMYHALGDARAYAYVREHFGILINAAEKNHGGIVKTIGDAVMAVFHDPADAFAAAEMMFAGIAEANRKLPEERKLVLKAGLNAGPCIVVNANDRLDYFGTTVNLAARLTDFSRGGELAISENIYRQLETRRRFDHQLATACFAQFVPRGFTQPVAIRLVPMG
jgi:class 3 adenylate cyclase